MRYTTK